MPFIIEEIKTVVFAMSPYKVVGPDGFHAGFYQRCWTTVGASVCNLVINFFQTGTLPQGVNEILIVLIPKISNPTLVS